LKRIIIVGSSGFVGKSLNNFLSKKNYKIINFSRSNKRDILKIKKLPKSDYIIYCIKTNDIKKSLYLFRHFKNLLKNYSKKIKILFFSSGSVYGPRFRIKKFKETDKVSLKKIDNFDNYKRNYAKEKIYLEKEFIKLSKKGFKVAIVRGFAFYGKYILKYNYLISEIINAIKTKKELSIQSRIFRSYMHANDMCKWLMKIVKNSSIECPIYNLGSDKKINLYKLIKFLNKKYKSKIFIKNKENKKVDFYIPSINLAKSRLKLKNTIKFENAINSLLK
tara:strand:- start:5047 stop:5877 length:831 start_codon:yes stop_codon:yes gene_type:complete